MIFDSEITYQGKNLRKLGDITSSSVAVLISCFVHSACEYGTLSKNKVRGKIVYCQGAGGDVVVEELGGTGTIMSNDQYEDTAFPTIAPGTYVSLDDGQRIDKYINSTR